MPVLGDQPVHGVFIRAPVISASGPDVDVLAPLDDGRIVAVRERQRHRHGVPSRARRRDALPPARRHDGRRARRPGRGQRPAATPDAAGEQADDPSRDRPGAAASGKVRMARLTDLAALGELSRLCQSDGADTRSLGLPVSGPPIGMFSLFRLPLGAFRPHDLLYVYEDDGRLAGLLRVERESQRDEWTIVELDAIGQAEAGDIRFRLVQHLLRDGAKRGAVRFHVACADADGNVELFMQAGLRPLRRGGRALPAAGPDAARPVDRRARPASSASGRRPRSTPWRSPGCTPRRPRSPSSVSRPPARGLGAPGDAVARAASSLAPILRFADVEAFVQEAAGRRQGRHGARRIPPGRRRQGGPAPLPQGDGPARARTRAARASSVSGVIAARTRQWTTATTTA